jgi:orotate phosphoribosyltransferase-like protein
MSKMAELSARIDELVEQGMTAKFIAATLNVPIEWAMDAMEQREFLELEKQYGAMGDGEFL